MNVQLVSENVRLALLGLGIAIEAKTSDGFTIRVTADPRPGGAARIGILCRIEDAPGGFVVKRPDGSTAATPSDLAALKAAVALLAEPA